ncbi:exonuclease domain-containing protein [Amphritea pacifica]|uniref:exonuclease domain-containing protein n=1 Tax=Amphritea pacifica TaxID=2811233 RepID=UPI0019646F28|nr:exonuclease domain-containing protein [Amphritea pacifica]MBN1006865.1 hypothetical protein [Amphritea pacifica]
MSDLWILDIEASGLSPVSYPIEIGLVNAEQEYQTLIRPEESWVHWSPKAHELHGLSRQHLFDKGQRAERVAQALNRLLLSETVYSDHQDWDSFWISRLFDAVSVEQKFHVADLNTLLVGNNMNTFVTRFDALSHASGHRAHRALNDARIIHRAAVFALNNAQ